MKNSALKILGLMTLMLMVACGDEQYASEIPAQQHESQSQSQSYGSSTTSNNCTAYRFPWLKEGNFWKIAWTELEIDVGWTDRSADYDIGSYTMIIGTPKTINGITMYNLEFSGDTQKFKPQWQAIGQDGCGNLVGQQYGSNNLYIVYSQKGNTWTGTGFFTNFSDHNPNDINVVRNGVVPVSSQYINRLPYFSENLSAVGYSRSESSYRPASCEFFPGVGTICVGADSGPQSKTLHREYWSPSAGPVLMHYSYDYEDCLGAACDLIQVERRAEVWFFGDTTSMPMSFETEPDSYFEPTPFPVSDTLFTMFSEVNKYDIPAGLIGNVPNNDEMQFAGTINDWYAFEIKPNQANNMTDFYISWNANVELGFYLFTAPDNEDYGFRYLGESQDWASYEYANHARFFSGSYAPGKYLLGVKQIGYSEHAVPYGIMSYSALQN